MSRRFHFKLVLSCWLLTAVGLALGSEQQPPAPRPRSPIMRLPPSRTIKTGLETRPTPISEQIERGESGGKFPALPPDPYQSAEPLPPLEEELFHHRGAHMYHPQGGILVESEPHESEHELHLRLPEDWIEPRPVTLFAPFLGVGPILSRPSLWSDYQVEPRFVMYGSYELFGFAFEEDRQRRDAIGHQLLLEMDLRLTGTERFHVQFRPVGKKNSGGSYYQFNDPSGYIDNSTGEPQRYWFETELHSWLGPVVDPLGACDTHLVVGRIPFVLQNGLLMNDEILAVVANQNNISLGPLSNLNLQWFYGFNDVDTYRDADAQTVGVNLFADHRRAFYELTYAFAAHERDSRRDSHYLAASRTQFYGPLTVAARALFKFGDRNGLGSGELFVLESSRTRYFQNSPLGVEYSVAYCNAFLATAGWSSLGGGNFNRLQTAFAIDPLTRISVLPVLNDTLGFSCGIQLFRHHEDESLIPEFSLQFPGGEAVVGFGLQYLRKTGPRTFLEFTGVYNESSNPLYDRAGVLVGHTIVF